MFILSLAGFALTQNAKSGGTSQNKQRVIELLADGDDQFKLPGHGRQDLILKTGEDVVLRVTAKAGGMKSFDGAVHGLVVRSLRNEGWNFRLKEGTQDLHVTAPSTPGEYKIECSVVCGPHHADMRMKMVVEP